MAPSRDTFVGRIAELRALRAHFADGARIVCVLGPAGIGKTRLVREFLDREAKQSRKSPTVWECSLADALSLEALCERVAGALHVPFSHGSSARDAALRIERSLAARSSDTTMLVLDNFEQLVEVGAETLAQWCRSAPKLRILVTSRIRLRCEFERVHELGPLSLPTAKSTEESSEALALFVDRVHRVRPNFRVEPHNRDALRELLRRLDGIPLAIELAAARSALLGLGDLLARLPAQLALLSGARNDGTGRAGTLRDALAWSWELLDETDRETFARCAVFRDGYTIAAAEAVLPGPSMLDQLQRLRDQSLLQVQEDNDGTGLVRLSLFQVLREFAWEKLRERPTLLEDALARHRNFYRSLASSLLDAFEHTGSSSVLQQLDAERANLLAALEYETSRTANEESCCNALELALALEPLMLTREPLLRYEALLATAVARAEPFARAALLDARVLRARAALERAHGRSKEAEQLLDRALVLARSLQDTALVGTLLIDQGVVLHQARDITQARERYTQALQHLATVTAPRAVGRAQGNLGALAHDVGDFSLARSYYQRALEAFRSLGDARLEGIFLTNLGILEQENDAFDRAAGCYERALSLLEAVGDLRLTAITQGNLGLLQHERGALDAAQRSHERSLKLLREVVDVRSQGLALGRLAAVLASLGQPERAAALMTEAEQVLHALDDRVALETARIAWGFIAFATANEASEPLREQALARARAQLERVRAPGEEGAKSIVSVSDDARLLARILERTLAAVPRESTLVLQLQRDAMGYAPPEGTWEDLHSQGTLRRVLLALAKQHDRSPGQGLTIEQLAHEVWPGEKILAEAASNRVYVAVAALRKRGLRNVLKRTPEGYLLEAALRIHWIERAPDQR